VVFTFNLRNNSWETISDKVSDVIMDEHTLIVTSDGLIVIGGMTAGPRVVANVTVLPKAPPSQKQATTEQKQPPVDHK